MATFIAPSAPMASTQLEDPKFLAAINLIALLISGVVITLLGIITGSMITTGFGGLLTVGSAIGLPWSLRYLQGKDK